MTNKFLFRYITVSMLLILSTILSLAVGAVFINPIDVIKDVFAHSNFIINEYRMPRMLLALIVGSSLSISGALIQGVVRNPLASPDVIGITKGASLTAVIIIMLFPISTIIYFTFWFVRWSVNH
jgi:ABC-type Fe3+-siderophore transport system permease subunit